MEQHSERRKGKRIKQTGTTMVSDEKADYLMSAQIGNICGNGLFLETEHFLKPGHKIEFRYHNPPYKALPKNYSATVQCCWQLSDVESVLPMELG